MKSVVRYILLFVFVLVSPVVAKVPVGAENWNSSKIDWYDLPTGVRKATVTGKPVVMIFHASWCTACRQYRTLFQHPGIVALAKDFVMILVDADKNKEDNAAFSPDGTYVPRTLFLDYEGNIQSTIRGRDPKYPHTIDIKDPAELLALMKQARNLLVKPKQIQKDATLHTTR